MFDLFFKNPVHANPVRIYIVEIYYYYLEFDQIVKNLSYILRDVFINKERNRY